MIYLLIWSAVFFIWAYIIYKRVSYRFYKLIFLSWLYLNGVFLIFYNHVHS